jgi:predicted ribosome quality control (RQC) complex YloA/Tae2 family protein
VLLSAHAELARVQRIAELPARGLDRDTPFSLVARKYLRNAHIGSIRQPRLERVFELDCEQRDAAGQHHRVVIIVEAMGRRSNLILVGEDGVILDAARRSPPSRNPRRPVLPHLPYVAPPAQDRVLPEQISAETLAAGARDQSSLAKHLSERIAGLSPLVGRELAFRATGSSDALVSAADWPSIARLAVAFLSVTDTHQWEPTVASDVDDRPLDYAPYRLNHLEAAGACLDGFETMSAAIEAYDARLAESGPAVRRGDPLAAERRALVPRLDRAIETTRRRISALEHQLATGHEQRNPLRRAGELMLTYQADLPAGSTELVVAGERFELDPHLTAIENAQAYFARYRKAREAEERVPDMLDEAQHRAAHLADLRALVEVAEGMEAIRALRREVGAATGGATPRSTATGKRGARTMAKSAPYRRVAVGDGWEALVGTSAAGNAAVTFDVAQADDVWLHARGVAGAHVIVRTNGREPPEAVIERAAQVAAWHSAARAAGSVEVDVAPRRHVKKIANAPPGLVRYTNERTIRVTPSA